MKSSILIILILLSWVNISTAKANNCNIKLALKEPIIKKVQNINLSSQVSLDLEQFLSYGNFDIYRIATNVICQKLSGTKYTGKIDEWQKFFDSALNGLLKEKYKEIKFTLVGNDDAVFKGRNISKEYIFHGDKDGNEQVIYNIAVMSENKQSLFTLSVSGNIAAEKEILSEYKRLVNSMDFNTTK
ncbi:hypothetical protein Q4493_00935 [Colwellia sp. 1_MG-2023]|uniref:hypothetical protein n=1 Tax=Colwellia sp. 1_MG-2023 TaxID=3062649 RepID=UPI0026E3D6F3|nr:hypothetical protein [Colwellia sp. 1_MG-2023]MDO6444328.1 hypothetical protein [Colwellia sp. 1_MG-2023]